MSRADTFTTVEVPNGPKVEVSIHDTGETWLLQVWLGPWGMGSAKVLEREWRKDDPSAPSNQEGER